MAPRLPAMALCLVLVCVVPGCRTLVEPTRPVPEFRLPAAARAAANRRASGLGVVLCTNTDYPWYYTDLGPWRRAADLVGRCFRDLLLVPEDRIWRHDNVSAADLRQIVAAIPARLPGSVVFYLAAHQKRSGRLLLRDGTLEVGELVGWLEETADVRLFILDACYAEVAESRVRGTGKMSRWYASGQRYKALAFPPRFLSRSADRFFRESLGSGPDFAVRDCSLFGLLFAHSLVQAMSERPRVLTAEQIAGAVAANAARLRESTRLTRVPTPVWRPSPSPLLLLDATED